MYVGHTKSPTLSMRKAHVLILLSNVVNRRLIVHNFYTRMIINDQNDYNVNKQLFIFLFSTCIVYIGTTSKINIRVPETGEGWGCNQT